eukprot:scaffold619916_cov13-Prasinocladus_malaysianus.AAC.1
MQHQAKCRTFQMRKKVSFQDSIALRPEAKGNYPIPDWEFEVHAMPTRRSCRWGWSGRCRRW